MFKVLAFDENQRKVMVVDEKKVEDCEDQSVIG